MPIVEKVETGINGLSAYKFGNIIHISLITITSGVAAGRSYSLGTLPASIRSKIPFFVFARTVTGTAILGSIRFKIDTNGEITWISQDTFSDTRELEFSATYISQ